MWRFAFIAFMLVSQTFASLGAFVVCRHADGKVELEWTDSPCCADAGEKSARESEVVSTKVCGDCVDTLLTLPQAETARPLSCDVHASFVVEMNTDFDNYIPQPVPEHLDLRNSSGPPSGQFHLAAVATTVILC